MENRNERDVQFVRSHQFSWYRFYFGF